MMYNVVNVNAQICLNHYESNFLLSLFLHLIHWWKMKTVGNYVP